jgi:FdhE protein
MTLAPGAAMASAGLAELARSRAEWRPWLALLDAARAEALERAWDAVVPAPPAAAGDARPLLAGATLEVDARRLRRWLKTLLRAAVDSGAPASALAAAGADTTRLAALLEAGLVEDAARAAAIATELGADAGALAAVAGIAPIPLLRACARRWVDRVPPAWVQGACPVCGAWAALAEVRGLERDRRLRCVRCAADWATPWMRCPYCGTGDHEALGSLVLAGDGGGESQPAHVATSLDTCQACHGYLKTLTTLAPLSADDVGLVDLATVELDAAAVARGYARPQGPGARLDARITTRAGSRLPGWWR